MDQDASPELNAPFFHYGCRTHSMAAYALGALSLLAVLHAAVYEGTFIWRYVAAIAMGLGLEAAYTFLDSGALRLRSGSSAVTAALLVMSIPTTTPLWAIFLALVVAIVLIRMPQRDHTLHLNPMLVGRLFLMLVYSESIINWTRSGIDPDAVSTATPLELFSSEGEVVNLLHLLMGRIGGNYEDLYELVPGSPGEAFAPLLILLGLFLVWRGVVAWRPGVWFIVAFALASLATGQPMLFSVASGSILFSAIFIVSDPKSSPVSKGGQCMFGIVAGVANAMVRQYTYYSEGIVFAVLFANLLSPTLDRLAFWLKGHTLNRRQKRFQRSQTS
jgi:electron transport complex protein RnfD